MFWKRWPYWVKGGVIMLILFFLPMILLGKYLGWEVLEGSWQFDVYRLLNEIPLLFGASTFGNRISGFVGYFVIGAFLGWLYGKIKKKVKNEN